VWYKQKVVTILQSKKVKVTSIRHPTVFSMFSERILINKIMLRNFYNVSVSFRNGVYLTLGRTSNVNVKAYTRQYICFKWRNVKPFEILGWSIIFKTIIIRLVYLIFLFISISTFVWWQWCQCNWWTSLLRMLKKLLIHNLYKYRCTGVFA